MNDEPLRGDPFRNIRWSTTTLEEFGDIYREQIEPLAGTEKPTHQWFRTQGFRPFLTALRRHHGLSFGQFWTEVLGNDTEEGYAWATSHGPTVDALERFLSNRQDRHGLSESSIAAKRRRLNAYARAYASVNDTGDLLHPVSRESDIPAYEAVDACYAAFDHLNRQQYGPATLQRIRGVVDDWYQHLVGRRIAGINPATGLYDEFRWEIPQRDPARLEAEHVRALVQAAETPRERLLVVALAGWGLRANEVARLHIRQFHRDATDPYLAFTERKNGPGQVSVLYGLDLLDERIDELSDGELGGEWSGYLFPSSQGRDPHVTRERIWSWFRDLAGRGGLPEEIDGEPPSPKLCRRFWYATYSEALDGVLAGLDEIAAEQGSSDPQVVLKNYLGEDRARQLRRETMRQRLSAAFEVE